MNTNILCCIECIINNTIKCEYCVDYCKINYYYKIKYLDKLVKIKKNSCDFLILEFDNNIFNNLSYNLNFYLDNNCENNIVTLIGLNNNLKIIKMNVCHCRSYYEFNNFKYKINIKQISKKLEKLMCENIYINQLPDLPDSLEELILKNTKLKELNNLPKNLKYLDCSKNQLTNLDNLPFKIKYLNCSYNNIKYLDNLNNNLEYLDCSHNNLTNLDNLPNSIKYLFTTGNNIKNMLYLPNSLIKLNSAVYSDIQSRDKCIKLLQKYNYTMAYK
jgi:hypothetical protein